MIDISVASVQAIAPVCPLGRIVARRVDPVVGIVAPPSELLVAEPRRYWPGWTA
ncbi:MAG: hypothetical protein ACYCWN_10820 [Ferrimicrobium sp.]|uniref:Uncharacterized protein n=1 Tax=Ferrimicrobium acidiphilum TaxID=121039 RepID=A0ABV3Y4T7_9ACTN|nr:hypothetical protein [Ferrimicrobium sp.]